MSFVENRAAFFADFGVTATIAGAPVSVIFDNDFLASLGIESSNPMAYAAASDVASVVQGDAVEIPAGPFSEAFIGTVVGVQPDGTGFTVLELQA